EAGDGVTGVKARLHAYLVVGDGEHAAEHLKYFFFNFCAAVLVAPGISDEPCCTVAIALGEQDAREHVTSLGGRRRLLCKEGPYRRSIDTIIPERVLGAPAE